MSSRTARSQRQEDVDKAFQIQCSAGVWGALRATAVGVGLAIVAHHTWPFFRRQTVPFKAFLVSGFTVFGLVFGAEAALLEHENIRRKEEDSIRRAARIHLATQGIIGTETEIARWRTQNNR